MSEALSGLLVVNKPAGLTSFDCVYRVKQILNADKVGHCGTLDPMAQGILLLLVGSATRLQESFLGLEKQYLLRGQFGHSTDTGDREGKIIGSKEFSDVTRPLLEVVLQAFKGPQSQIPPRYAALKYKGKAYYHWARKGIDIPRAPRSIELYSLELLSFEGAFWDARVTCSRGTYIRTLVEDIAARLHTLATLHALVRERVGTYDLINAIPWDRVMQSSRDHLLAHLQCAVLS